MPRELRRFVGAQQNPSTPQSPVPRRARKSRIWRPRQRPRWDRRGRTLGPPTRAQRARTTFCWLPPLKNLTMEFDARGLTSRRSACSSLRVAAAARLSQPSVLTSPSVAILTLSATLMSQHQPVVAAVSGHEHHASFDRLRGRSHRHGRPGEQDPSRPSPADPVEGVDQLGATRADYFPASPTISPALTDMDTSLNRWPSLEPVDPE